MSSQPTGNTPNHPPRAGIAPNSPLSLRILPASDGSPRAGVAALSRSCDGFELAAPRPGPVLHALAIPAPAPPPLRVVTLACDNTRFDDDRKSLDDDCKTDADERKVVDDERKAGDDDERKVGDDDERKVGDDDERKVGDDDERKVGDRVVSKSWEPVAIIDLNRRLEASTDTGYAVLALLKRHKRAAASALALSLSHRDLDAQQMVSALSLLDTATNLVTLDLRNNAVAEGEARIRVEQALKDFATTHPHLSLVNIDWQPNSAVFAKDGPWLLVDGDNTAVDADSAHASRVARVVAAVGLVSAARLLTNATTNLQNALHNSTTGEGILTALLAAPASVAALRSISLSGRQFTGHQIVQIFELLGPATEMVALGMRDVRISVDEIEALENFVRTHPLVRYIDVDPDDVGMDRELARFSPLERYQRLCKEADILYSGPQPQRDDGGDGAAAPSMAGLYDVLVQHYAPLSASVRWHVTMQPVPAHRWLSYMLYRRTVDGLEVLAQLALSARVQAGLVGCHLVKKRLTDAHFEALLEALLRRDPVTGVAAAETLTYLDVSNNNLSSKSLLALAQRLPQFPQLRCAVFDENVGLDTLSTGQAGNLEKTMVDAIANAPKLGFLGKQPFLGHCLQSARGDETQHFAAEARTSAAEFIRDLADMVLANREARTDGPVGDTDDDQEALGLVLQSLIAEAASANETVCILLTHEHVLPQLKHANLAAKSLIDEDLKVIVQLLEDRTPRLKTLSVRNNLLTDASAQMLSRLRSRQSPVRLNVSGNQFSEQAMHQLRSKSTPNALPHASSATA